MAYFTATAKYLHGLGFAPYLLLLPELSSDANFPLCALRLGGDGHAAGMTFTGIAG